jgi:Zn-dependent M28 family amino/carboxypeptidase
METQFIGLGLKPAMGNASYIQDVPLQKSQVEETESGFVLSANGVEEKLNYGKDFILSPYFASASSEVNAALVFVGFGITAPEFNHDDYKNIDVKGKIVVILNDAPNTIPTSERAYYTSNDAKYNEAIKRGAVGVIKFSLPSNKRFNWERSVQSAKSAAIKWVDKQSVAANSFKELKVIATFNNQNIEKLFARAKVKVSEVYALSEQGKSKSFPLNISAAIRVKTVSRPLQSSNVAGLISGSDPVLKNEYIVYSSHLDHFGIGKPVNGDSIYNGAHDDASGNAILLEIARAYRSLATPPKRSIVFLAVTGEESGLLGSDYFASNVPLQNGKIVANLCIDMPFFFHPILDIVPYGADHSSLGKQALEATKTLGIKISPDPFPEQVVFIRSDHYSFIKKGIPALFIKSGFMTVPEDTVDRAKSDVGWRSTHYHTPKDDMNQAFDFNAAAMHVKVNFLIGYLVSNEPKAPTWNKGDFFGGKFSNVKR